MNRESAIGGVSCSAGGVISRVRVAYLTASVRLIDNNVVSVGLEKFRRKVLRSDGFLTVDDESAVLGGGCVVRLERDEPGLRDASARALGFFSRLYHLDLARCEIFDPL